MVLESIDREAKSAGLRYVGLADHIDEPGHNERPLLNRADLAGRSWDIEFLVGCEATALAPGVLAVTDEVAKGLDYVMVSANHYHLSSVENPVDRSPASYADHYLSMLAGLLDWGLADLVAHPFLHSKLRGVLDPMDVFDQYDWDRIEKLVERATECDLGFEIKPLYGDLEPDFFSELVRICRRWGVRFSLGTDAHRLSEIAYPDGFPGEISRIGLRKGDLIDPEVFLSR